MSTAIKTVTDDDFAARVLESERPVVVDFWAAWCPPCRMMDPILRDLAQERPDLDFVKLDADANARTVTDHGVLSMPTLMVFHHGRAILRLVGSRPKGRLRQELESALSDMAGPIPA